MSWAGTARESDVAEQHSEQSKTGKKARARAGNGSTDGIEAWIASLDPSRFLAASGNNLEHWAATNRELLEFWSDQAKKNASRFETIGKCRTGEEYISAMARVSSDVVHDLADEFDRVLAINVDR